MTSAMQAESPIQSPEGKEARLHFSAVTFEFNRSGVQVPHWKIEVHPDGSGVYLGSSADGVASAGQAIQISDAEEARLSVVYPFVRNGNCETRMKNIANTGRKTLSFQLSDGATSTCTFNFSDSELVNVVADIFLSIAETMQAGERLAQKHRYDRLGLDAEIDSLAAEVKGGRATDVMNIAPVLQSIVDDERLMERVQRKAARLLQDAGGSPAAASAR